MIYIFIIAAIAAADQFIKMLVVNNPGMMNEITVIEDFFYIHCIPNHGIAMGMFEGRQAIVITVTAVLMILLTAYIFIHRKTESKVFLFILSMIVGGGIGNIIDRIRLGYVVDYLDFRVIWDYIFNFADICVVAGCFAMIVWMFYSSYCDRKKSDEV